MAKKKAFDDEVREHGEAALAAEFKRVFDACPEISGIRWRQYTPYFNDGDACEFSVGEFEWAHNQTDEEFPEWCTDDDDDLDEQFGSSYGAEGREAEVQSAVNSLERIPKEIFEVCFDDHASIIATREGFTVEEYSHD
jgi:hypothetical protein